MEVSPDTHDPVAAAESQALAAEIEAAADEPDGDDADADADELSEDGPRPAHG